MQTRDIDYRNEAVSGYLAFAIGVTTIYATLFA
jgi:hypothetical protein